jgi:hypothetical protein
MREKPTALDLLEADLDARIVSLWVVAWEVEEWDSEVLGPFLRVAYWTGYTDALTEAQREELYSQHGQAVPSRKAERP